MKRLILGVVVVMLALAGCTPTDAPTPTPSATNVSSATPSATLAPTESATPSPTAAPLTRPTLDQLVLTTAGFAELPLGSSPASFDPATSIVELVTIQCDGTAVSGWEPVEKDPHMPWSAFGIGVNPAGFVTAIQVRSSLISTERNIAIGSARADVLAAYPGIEITASNNYWDVYVVEDERGFLRMSVVNSIDVEGVPDRNQGTVQEMWASFHDSDYLPYGHALALSCL